MKINKNEGIITNSELCLINKEDAHAIEVIIN